MIKIYSLYSIKYLNWITCIIFNVNIDFRCRLCHCKWAQGMLNQYCIRYH